MSIAVSHDVWNIKNANAIKYVIQDWRDNDNRITMEVPINAVWSGPSPGPGYRSATDVNKVSHLS